MHFSCFPVKSAQSQHLFPRQLPAHLTAAPVSGPAHASPTLPHNLKDVIRKRLSPSPVFSPVSWHLVHSQVFPMLRKTLPSSSSPGVTSFSQDVSTILAIFYSCVPRAFLILMHVLSVCNTLFHSTGFCSALLASVYISVF